MATIKPRKTKLTSAISKTTNAITKAEKQLGKGAKLTRKSAKRIQRDLKRAERIAKRKERERIEREKLATMTPEQRRIYMLRKSVKRINQRITSLEKSGYTMTDAYQTIKRAKYWKIDIVQEKTAGQKTPTAKQGTAGGGLKIRTDLSNMTPEQIDSIERLIHKFESKPSTITEIKADTAEKLKNYWEKSDEYYATYNGAILDENYAPETFDVSEFTDDELQQYLRDRERITADAIAKAFYFKDDLTGKSGFSDLYYAVDRGDMSYQQAKEYAINNLIWLYRHHGLDAENEFFDEDIIQAFYTGGQF